MNLLILLSLVLSLSGCNETPTQKIQQGVLDVDKTLKIGDAFGSYKYFKGVNWKEEKDSQGRSVVVFEGELNVNTDLPINKAIYEANSVELQDAIAFVDLVRYYNNYPLSIHGQLDKNKIEVKRVLSKADDRRGLASKFVVIFSLSLKDEEIVIVDKQLLLTDSAGNRVEVMCDQQQVANKVLNDVYKNQMADNDMADCIFKSQIIPISSLPEYPKDIQYLKGSKTTGP